VQGALECVVIALALLAGMLLPLAVTRVLALAR
jgi:hypothetical protein